MDRLAFKQTREFLDFLTGDTIPAGFTFKHPPTLTSEQAFAVVYYLQERLDVIPDTFEMCQVCKVLFDTTESGFTLDGSSTPDEWHQDHGITAEMLLANDGTQLCSEQCEMRFWRLQEA